MSTIKWNGKVNMIQHEYIMSVWYIALPSFSVCGSQKVHFQSNIPIHIFAEWDVVLMCEELKSVLTLWYLSLCLLQVSKPWITKRNLREECDLDQFCRFLNESCVGRRRNVWYNIDWTDRLRKFSVKQLTGTGLCLSAPWSYVSTMKHGICVFHCDSLILFEYIVSSQNILLIHIKSSRLILKLYPFARCSA